MGGRLHHTARAAAWAKAAPFAAKRHQVFMPTTIALDAQKTVFQQAALQVVVEFLAHEFWQVTATMLYLLNEAWVMCSNDGIECGLFRLVPMVGGNACGNGLNKH